MAVLSPSVLHHNDFMKTIPHIIHLIHRSAVEIPEQYLLFYEQMRKYHPEWRIIRYGDKEARQIVADHMPELLAVYNAYPRDVQRTDIFRVLAVYLFGGFYLDFDMLCMKSLDDLCRHGLVLGEEKTFTREECRQAGLRNGFRIANYMFGSLAGHEFWRCFLTEAVALSNTVINSEEDVLNTTGPGLLTDVYHKHGMKYKDISVVRNETLVCRKACETVSCHFGDYAAHFHLGSWRWEAQLSRVHMQNNKI
jgi:mannosyltransferase OCH1-like enzyme